MLKIKGHNRFRATGRWSIAIFFMMLALPMILSNCALDRQLPLEPGTYAFIQARGIAETDVVVERVEADRDDQRVAFIMSDGSAVTVSVAAREPDKWLSGCPANIGSTSMEVLDIAGGPLMIGEIRFEKPILVRDCPAESERVALREDGPVDLGGSACAGSEKCLSFARQSPVSPVQTAPIVNAKPLLRSMKGYELYSWRDEPSDNWRYTLMTGTNRLKTVEEIIAEENQVTQSEWVKITTDGTAALKALLKRLPPGTELFWLDDERLAGAHESTAIVALPEASVVETVENLCRQLEIQLHTSQ